MSHRHDDEHFERAALHALDTLPADERAAIAAHLATCDACRAEEAALAAAVSTLGMSVPPVAPPPGLKARVLAQARRERPSHAFRFLLQGQGEWITVSPGVATRDLARDAHSHAYLVRLDPGSHALTHGHAATEHCYVLSGDLHIAGEHLRTGDYHLAHAGSVHDAPWSDGGAVILIVESPA